MGRQARGGSGRARLAQIVAAAIVGAVAAGCASATDAPVDLGTTGSGSSAGEPISAPTSPNTTDNPADSSGSDQAAEPFTVLAGDVHRRRDGAPAEQARKVLAGFGIDLLRRVVDESPNTVISPYSLYTVLAMVRAGVEGETARQLDEALHAHGAEEQGAVMVTVDEALAAATAREPGIILDKANQVWIQDGFEVRGEYLDALAEQYGIEAVAAAFADAPEEVRAAINAWVSDRTRGLITDLFPEGSITGDTRLALVNALYLKAAWAMPFGAPQGSSPFTTADGRTVATPMMPGIGTFDGTVGDGWTSVTLPYEGWGLSMTLLVPDAGHYDGVLDRLDSGLLAEASGYGAERQDVMLTMPPFETRSEPDVLAAMKELGVTDLFDAGTADLSRVTAASKLYVQALVHQAVISVDRNGTEAAAASGASVAETAAPADPVVLTVDRPFLYWIADSVTGALLFIGTVTDPTA